MDRAQHHSSHEPTPLAAVVVDGGRADARMGDQHQLQEIPQDIPEPGIGQFVTRPAPLGHGNDQPASPQTRQVIRHALPTHPQRVRQLRRITCRPAELERSAADALVTGTAGALVAMAFLAVLREGLETVVFLIATFNASTSATAAAGGAILGILVAIAVGYGIYRGGVRLNLARFFRVTGAVLVLIAAGLLATAAHTAHEAGWIDVGQTPVLDLSWLVRPGTPWSSLFTGMLGIQPRPVVLEVLLWVFYLVPMSAFVLWPRHRRSPHASAATAGATQ
jgi:hypothetical protein